MRAAAALAERLGLPVRDLELLEQALVHSSWLHEHRDAARGHNERLEFLGDVVINLAISDALFDAYPTDDEGLLSTRRASIVSATGLARLAHRIDLGPLLKLGEGEAQRGGRRRPSLLASAFEAVAGAVYLDLGWEVARTWLTTLAGPELANDSPSLLLKSPKSRLQEYTQRRTGAQARLPDRRRDWPGPRQGLPDRGLDRGAPARRRRGSVSPDRRDSSRGTGPRGDSERAGGERERRGGGRIGPGG